MTCIPPVGTYCPLSAWRAMRVPQTLLTPFARAILSPKPPARKKNRPANAERFMIFGKNQPRTTLVCAPSVSVVPESVASSSPMNARSSVKLPNCETSIVFAESVVL